jgi:hypothetical protein
LLVVRRRVVGSCESVQVELSGVVRVSAGATSWQQ